MNKIVKQRTIVFMWFLSMMLLCTQSVKVLASYTDSEKKTVRFVTSWNEKKQVGGKFKVSDDMDFPLSQDMLSASYTVVIEDSGSDSIAVWDVTYKSKSSKISAFPAVSACGSDKLVGWVDERGESVTEKTVIQSGSVYYAVYEKGLLMEIGSGGSSGTSGLSNGSNNTSNDSSGNSGIVVQPGDGAVGDTSSGTSSSGGTNSSNGSNVDANNSDSFVNSGGISGNHSLESSDGTSDIEVSSSDNDSFTIVPSTFHVKDIDNKKTDVHTQSNKPLSDVFGWDADKYVVRQADGTESDMDGDANVSALQALLGDGDVYVTGYKSDKVVGRAVIRQTGSDGEFDVEMLDEDVDDIQLRNALDVADDVSDADSQTSSSENDALDMHIIIMCGAVIAVIAIVLIVLTVLFFKKEKK